MSTLAMSLRRLYLSDKVTKEKIDELHESGKLSQEEYDYIMA